MILLFNVVVGNCLDDYTRNVILTCDSKDLNVLHNLHDDACAFVELCDFSEERILSVKRIEPINISCDKELSDIVDKTFSIK